MKKWIFVLGLFLSFNVYCDEITIIDQTDPNDATTKCGDNCTWTLYSDGTLEIKGTGEMYEWRGIGDTSYGHDYASTAPWDKYYNSVQKVDISGVSSIGTYSFRHFGLLSEINISDDVLTIGYGAFDYVPALSELKLPDNLTTISDAAFMYNEFSNLTIPDSVTYLSPTAFYNSSLTNLYCSSAQKQICLEALKEAGYSDERIENVLKLYQKQNGQYFYKGKFYKNSSDVGSLSWIKKRIYSIDEANLVTGEKNRISIKYK